MGNPGCSCKRSKPVQNVRPKPQALPQRAPKCIKNEFCIQSQASLHPPHLLLTIYWCIFSASSSCYCCNLAKNSSSVNWRMGNTCKSSRAEDPRVKRSSSALFQQREAVWLISGPDGLLCFTFSSLWNDSFVNSRCRNAHPSQSPNSAVYTNQPALLCCV